MLMFKPLIFSLLTLFGISAKAAAGKWSPGTGLWIYAQINPQQKGTFKCPPVKPAADSEVSLCRIHMRHRMVRCSRNPEPRGRRVILSSLGGPTPVKVMELEATTDSGYWTTVDNTYVYVYSERGPPQKFEFRPTGSSNGAYFGYLSDIVVPLAVDPSGALIIDEMGITTFCLYDTVYGNAVIP
ncbi:hypothetical protein BKA81DRAFT_422214 [Phyllosticta paracitricarpa]|uniref:Uncharacterized protein n=1 Tax=Phyllosticta paracitricarpa TaxID=2016321 RepID=A0ABR1MZG5_9PEZI